MVPKGKSSVGRWFSVTVTGISTLRRPAAVVRRQPEIGVGLIHAFRQSASRQRQLAARQYHAKRALSDELASYVSAPPPVLAKSSAMFQFNDSSGPSGQ